MSRLGLLAVAVALGACEFEPNGQSATDTDTDTDSATDTDADAAAGTDAAPPAPDAIPPPACVGKAAQPIDAEWELAWDGETRVARVHVPASYDPSARAPLVLNFHGYAMNAGWQAEVTGYEQHADAEGFVVVHAEGLGVIQGWNAGDCCGTPAATDADDVGFVSALLDRLEDELCIDADRIYASGFSNGGFLSHRLACEIAPRLAAIASVSGVMGIDDCSPGRPVPVLAFHGTSDLTVPYDGSVVLGFESVADTMEGWRVRNGCSDQVTDTFATGDAHCERFVSCELGADVELCTLAGDGHQWPGGVAIPASGQVNHDIDATAAIWSFFVDHPRP
jgi:polyhydroxybutyrate depolymerase